MAHETSILEGIHYRSGKIIQLGVTDGILIRLTEVEEAGLAGQGKLKVLPVIAPGLVDLQINGFKGVDFNDPDLSPEQIETAAQGLLQAGVTSFYPTLITASKKKTALLLKTFASAIGRNGLASGMVGGIHLEGPFISPEDGPRGAHPKQHCLLPDLQALEEWQEIAHGRIRILTLAPELAGSEKLIRSATGMGMAVAIGHTAASSRNIELAVNAGATLSTHLGNGCHSLLPRHPNYLWDQLAEDRLFASMIADGFHLPEAVLKVFFQIKKEKAILISDGMPYTGLNPGVYESPATGRVRLTPEGKLHCEGREGILAGSASTLLDGVKKMAGMVGFATAWEMASLHPQSLLSPISARELQVGNPADLALLDPDLNQVKITGMYKNGFSFPQVTSP